MATLRVDGIEYWVGRNPKLGIVLYAEHWQASVPPERVRLFVLAEARMGTFVKDITRELLVGKPPFKVSSTNRGRIEHTVRRIERVTADFTRGLTVHLKEAEGVRESVPDGVTKRVTHCYGCKRNLNSWDFSLCKECSWILCSCGACGCAWAS